MAMAVKRRVFVCRDCGHRQETLWQQENWTRYPSGEADFINTQYVFECGHTEDFSDNLKVVER